MFNSFGKTNGCTGASTQYKTPYDGQNELYCVNHGSCSGGDLVRCSWNGGHNWYGNSATKNGGLVTFFLLQWTETSHMGFGNKSEGSPLEDIEILEDEPSKPGPFDDFDVTLEASPSGHYSNPSSGCLDDEDIIPLGDGEVCAFKIGTTGNGNGNFTEPPEPACVLGGVSPTENGCPKDAPVDANSKAYPLCLPKGLTASPYENSEFHCVLACPCDKVVDDGCGAEAHAHCPSGATCQRGELRNRGQGICTYPSSTVV